MAALCSSPLNELVMVQAITEWTLCLEEAEMSLATVHVRWEGERWNDGRDGEKEELREGGLE